MSCDFLVYHGKAGARRCPLAIAGDGPETTRKRKIPQGIIKRRQLRGCLIREKSEKLFLTGNLAILCSRTHGFASLPYGRFAFFNLFG